MIRFPSDIKTLPFVSCLLFLGFHVEGNSRQRLQKSVSLDETKTKMASCIIKSVLSKKMQVEQNNSNTSYLQKKRVVLPSLPQPADKQMLRNGGGGKTGGGVFKAPVHLVRDMRSLVKNTYSLSFSTAPTTTPENNNKQTSLKVIDQEDSPPPPPTSRLWASKVTMKQRGAFRHQFTAAPAEDTSPRSLHLSARTENRVTDSVVQSHSRDEAANQ